MQCVTTVSHKCHFNNTEPQEAKTRARITQEDGNKSLTSPSKLEFQHAKTVGHVRTWGEVSVRGDCKVM